MFEYLFVCVFVYMFFFCISVIFFTFVVGTGQGRQLSGEYLQDANPKCLCICVFVCLCVSVFVYLCFSCISVIFLSIGHWAVGKVGN